VGVRLGLSLSGKNSLRMFKTKVLRKVFGPKREAGKNCIMRSFIICTLHQMLLG
jgi:hypothetical protein